MKKLLRVYIFETDEYMKLALFRMFADHEELRKHFELIGIRTELAQNSSLLPETDVVLLDPRILPLDASAVQIVMNVWRRFSNRIEIVIHDDCWTSQDYRSEFKDLGVSRGIVRGDFKRLIAILKKLLPSD